MSAPIAVAGAAGSTSTTETAHSIIPELEQVIAEIPTDHFFPAQLIANGLQEYSTDDQRLILKDFEAIRESTFQGVKLERSYIVTAGAPGSGKSTLLEKLNESTYPDHAYIDPDRTCIPNMKHTHGAMSGTSEEKYNKWRSASNFIANTLIALAVKEGYAISHGSTLTGGAVLPMLRALRINLKYDVRIIHLTTSDEVRKASLESRRSAGTWQCTDRDFTEKAKAFRERMVTWRHANHVDFYGRFKFDQVVKAAHWTARDGRTIDDSNAAQQIADWFEPAMWPMIRTARTKYEEV